MGESIWEDKSAGWWARVVCTVVFSVMIVGSIGANISANAQAAGLEKDAAALAQEHEGSIATLEERLAELDAELSRDLANASAAGNAVAELQDSYLELDPADEAYEKDAEEVASEMDAYLGKGASGARTPWSPADGSWKFSQDIPFEGASWRVGWIQSDAQGRPLCIVSAEYDRDSGRFSDFAKHATPRGGATEAPKRVSETAGSAKGAPQGDDGGEQAPQGAERS